MEKKILLILSFILPLSFSSFSQQVFSPSALVNPFIGTGGHGHTYPGSSLPFGMVQLSPDTRLEGWDGCSGYHYTDSIIYGFSHTHLSGTGCSDYGDILIMPVIGEVELKAHAYASSFSKSREEASAGYYSVVLDNFNIRAELTTTERTGFHRYTFPASENAGIVVDLEHRDKVIGCGIKVTGKDEIEGYRISQSWAAKQILYFAIKFSKPFTEAKLDSLHSMLSFSTEENEKILVKVGISAVSSEGAKNNLLAEIPGWDFDFIRRQASQAWDNALAKITLAGATLDQQQTFYTAMYHAMLQPNVYCDVDGQYRGRDLKIHRAEDFRYYTVFSLWDTYRAAHPLYTLLETKRSNDFILTFLRQYEEGGLLPVWELSGNETDCMIGYHAVPVIADAYLKGIRDFPADKALEAMKHSAMQDALGLKYYKTKGYIPSDMEGESVSKTLEYAYDDWCIAMMAKAMGKEDDYKTYVIRAQYYKNIFDPSTGFMRAKSNETWFSPFDPAEVNFNYTEANAWQYSFYVPQDIDGLIELLGGKERFAARLDALFTTDSKITGRDQADISGMIGQYAHGNEPSHHMAYLYNYAAQPWKTQALVKKIIQEFYNNSPDGLIGNEDCGQMSAWYIFSALGFYPVTPGSGIYVLGCPIFPKARLNLENGKIFTILAKNISDTNIYIQSVVLNGTPYFKSYIRHEDIMNGGEIVFTMGAKPNKAWGNNPGSSPTSRIHDNYITPVPSVEIGEKSFFDATYVSLANPIKGTTIYYTLNGTEPSYKSELYTVPFKFTKSTKLRAIASQEGILNSFPIEANFIKIKKNRKISLNTQYANQYSGGGDHALIDFIRGGENFKTGTWQGYERVDVNAVVDLGSLQALHKISLGCLHDQASWIFLPEEVTFSVSTDGKIYTEIGQVKNDLDDHTQVSTIKEFSYPMKMQKARFIKVVAKNIGNCPEWHPGAGHKAWIFVDEISIE